MRVYWHRLFGLILMDYLSNRESWVGLVKDLFRKRQLLDAGTEPGNMAYSLIRLP